MPLSVSYVGDGVVGDDVGSVGGGVVGDGVGGGGGVREKVGEGVGDSVGDLVGVRDSVETVGFAIPWLPVVLLKACVFGGGWSAVEGGGGL